MKESETIAQTESGVVERKWDNDDLATVKIRVLQGHRKGVKSCQLIQTSQKVLSASADCSVRVWDVTSGKCLQCYDVHGVSVSEAHSTPDGSSFLSCGWDKKLKLWDTETGKCVLEKAHDDLLTCCRISHNQNLVAVGSDFGRALNVYDLVSGDIVHNIKEYHNSGLTSVTFAPADDKVITTSRDKTTRFFDLVTGNTTITLEGHSNIVSSCSITADERNFATASWDKNILLWDIATGRYRSKGPSVLRGSHDGCVSCCEFSNDGLLLVSGSYDTSIVVWDVENCVQKLKLQGHTGWVNDVCFSEDQNWILSASEVGVCDDTFG